MTTNFTPEETLAIANAINAATKKQAQREMIPTGVENKRIVKSRPIDMTIRVTGVIGRSEDRERESTCSTLTQHALAAILHHCGCTGVAAEQLLLKVFTEQMTMGKEAKDELLKSSGVDKALKRFKSEVVAKLPKTHVLGTVKADITIEKV